MGNTERQKITIETTVDASIEKVWKYWNEPKHITKWYFASDDWYAPHAENDLKVGGKFNTRMAAKDGSGGFDFFGFYDEIILNKYILITLGDGRKVEITFIDKKDTVEIIETFETEEVNAMELQRFGWQAILNNFKKYTENF